MNQTALQKQIDELSREFSLSGDAVEKRLIALRAEILRIRVDILAIRKVLSARYPGFADEFEKNRLETKLEERLDFD